MLKPAKLIIFWITALVSIFPAAHSFAQNAQTTPTTALRDYLHNGDPTFSWEIADSTLLDGAVLYEVLLTSQQWREHTWKHQMNVTVPLDQLHDGALLFISSGSIRDGLPNRRDPAENREAQALARMAVENRAITAVLYQTPNQPLYGGKTEDELISYTLHNFQGDGDYSWPLLFPMVKSAVRAMDAVQQIAREKAREPVNRFLLSGLSKRGWTTWLTSAQDDRVEAFAPMVIDILNMPVNLNYQIDVWQDYSPQIQDYVALGIVQDIESERGKTLAQMIDPYSYRALMDKPKMIFMGTNDPYWVVDAVRHYLDSIPGENFLHYVPNAGHGLGDKEQAFGALASFWDFTLKRLAYPTLRWTAEPGVHEWVLDLEVDHQALKEMHVWEAHSPTQDFREATWSRSPWPAEVKDGKWSISQKHPDHGFRAFYVDFTFEDDQGRLYSQSTRVFVQAPSAITHSEFIFPIQEQHVHGSSVVELPNGDLLVAWFQGSGERSADDVRIMGARKKKGSADWSEPFELADTPHLPDCNPVLFMAGDELFLVWIAVQANRWEQSILRLRKTRNYEGDAAPVWSWQDNILLKPGDEFALEVEAKLKELPSSEAGWAEYARRYDVLIQEASRDASKRSTGWMTRIKPLILDHGEILLPLYSDGFNLSLIARSTDGGQSWLPSLPIVGRGPIQPALIQKKNGHIVAYMRDSGDAPTRVQESQSLDGGKSWSVARKTSMPNGASVDAVILPDGRWAMLNNDVDDGRYRLTLHLSSDEGQSWSRGLALEWEEGQQGRFSYPSMIVGRDGQLHISYSYHTSDPTDQRAQKSIRYVRIDPDHLLHYPLSENTKNLLK